MPHRKAAYQTFWGTTVPTTTNSSQNTTATFAVRYKLTVAGTVLAMRYAREKRTFGTILGVLWNDISGDPITSCLFRKKAAAGTGFDRWETKYFHPKYHVAAGDILQVSITFESVRGMYNAGALTAADVTHGNITALKDGTNAHPNSAVGTDAVLIARGTDTGDLEGIDLVFVPDP